jgi:acyl carrier protein
MTQTDFLEKLAHALMEKPGSFQADTELQAIPGWDSMGKVATLSMLDEEFQYQPPPDALDRCVRVKDLLAFVQQHVTS